MWNDNKVITKKKKMLEVSEILSIDWMDRMELLLCFHQIFISYSNMINASINGILTQTDFIESGIIRSRVTTSQTIFDPWGYLVIWCASNKSWYWIHILWVWAQAYHITKSYTLNASQRVVCILNKYCPCLRSFDRKFDHV